MFTKKSARQLSIPPFIVTTPAMRAVPDLRATEQPSVPSGAAAHPSGPAAGVDHRGAANTSTASSSSRPLSPPLSPAPPQPRAASAFAPAPASAAESAAAATQDGLVRHPDGVDFIMTVGIRAYRISFHPQAPTQADLDEVSHVMQRLMAVAHDVAHARGLSPARIIFAEGRAQLYGRLPNGNLAEIHLDREREDGLSDQVDRVERGLDEIRRIFAGRVRFSAEAIERAARP